jgi:hypothetical protein
MLTRADVCLGVAEIRAGLAKAEIEISANTIALEIGNRNARVQALQERWQKLNNHLCFLLASNLRLKNGVSASGPSRDFRNKLELVSER